MGNFKVGMAALLAVVTIFLTGSCWAQNDTEGNNTEKSNTEKGSVVKAEWDDYIDSIKIRSSLQKCLDNAQGATFPMRDCLTTEYAYQDQRLNQVYQKLMSTLAVKDKEKLRREEKGWLRYRDGKCNSGLELGGQAKMLESLDCEVDDTARRATELEWRVKQ
jgi:uncharacterized protein YecT (DUF1311 family)